jgi:7,8-dihydropterin-6-yl-methyl-4-(beta-D-ribofuranosyl)aminobenzene 5'-phosphate synthase
MVMGQIGALKITTLAENLVQAGGLGQWGLSFLLELVDAKGDARKIVFDTGANREALLHNVKLLEADLGDVDCVVLSHGHGDHTAATVEVVEAAGGVRVYGHPHTFLPRVYVDRDGKRHRGGPPEGEGLADIEGAGGEVVLSAGPVEVVPGIWTTGQVERVTSFERVPPPRAGSRRIIVVDGEEEDDQILDDQSLWADVGGVGPFVITGCAHAGPVNTLLQVRRLGPFERIRGLVGGTHLVGRTEDYIEQTIDELKRFGLEMISPCHCTGFKATTLLWRAFPEEFVLNYSCRVIEAGREPEPRVV